ncbi:MAG: flagellar biosynthesis anti-sigma factor FlgM [Acidocella sp.]|uniref:flagellar biosynthesis anti-sigma factor FlgM n=1 Tax=Acidocella sp. TaxID=50710 RepID=UPI003FBD2DD1
MNEAAPTTTAKPRAAAEATPQTEAVTLSDAAQTSTQLLSSAHQSDGMDHAEVARIRSALATGNYNVAPEDLAQAMVTVLKATSK